MLIETSKFVDELISEFGIKEFVGVSDSTLKYLINEVTNRGIYKPFTNEGDAVAYAAGRTVAGYPTAVLMQNSGLTNASSPISSLTSLYKIPLVYIVGWRGCPRDDVDEPQHSIIGENTINFIKSICDYNVEIKEVGYAGSNILSSYWDNHSNRQKFFLVRRDSFTKVDLNEPGSTISRTPKLCRKTCIEFIKRLAELDEDVIILSTTGYTSRELMSFGEEFPRNFYMFGSMGCLISFASGVADTLVNKKVIVLDGDGSFLMRPEGAYITTQLSNNSSSLVHIIFDNGCHLSTGGQKIPTNNILSLVLSTSKNVSYPRSYNDFKIALQEWYKDNVNHRETLLVSVTAEADKSLPRPSRTPEELLDNFKKGIQVNGSNSK